MKTPAECEEKISKNIDFGLWGNRTTILDTLLVYLLLIALFFPISAHCAKSHGFVSIYIQKSFKKCLVRRFVVSTLYYYILQSKKSTFVMESVNRKLETSVFRFLEVPLSWTWLYFCLLLMIFQHRAHQKHCKTLKNHHKAGYKLLNIVGKLKKNLFLFVFIPFLDLGFRFLKPNFESKLQYYNA